MSEEPVLISTFASFGCISGFTSFDFNFYIFIKWIAYELVLCVPAHSNIDYIKTCKLTTLEEFRSF